MFHVTPPEPADTTPGARVPSRQLSRFLDSMLVHVAVIRGPDGTPKVDTQLLSTLKETDGRSIKASDLPSAFPELPTFLDDAVHVAGKAAVAKLAKLLDSAQAAIEDERDVTMVRIRLALEHQGLPEGRIEQALMAELNSCDHLLKALAGTTVTLDSACAFVINR
jgi:ATP-dependent helicase HepA